MLAFAPAAHADEYETFYSTYLNRFDHFANGSTAIANGNYLQTSNSSDKYIFVTDNLQLSGQHRFTFNLRIANLNNEEGKRYKYTESNSGKTRKIESTEYGAVWNFADTANYMAVTLRCENSNIHDILDRRSMVAKIISVKNGKEKILKTVTLYEDVNLSKGFNLIRIVYDEQSTTICLGEKRLTVIAQLSGIDNSTIGRFGYIVGKGACAEVERLVLHTTPIDHDALMTNWDTSSIDERISNSKDAYEGYWTYLDRNLNDKRMRLGGKYQVALIKNGSDYDIIYLSGSKVNSDEWRSGMLKGRLIHTIFLDNYNLVWYDSLKVPFDDDEYATFEKGSILTLHFPIHESQMRFYKNQATEPLK